MSIQQRVSVSPSFSSIQSKEALQRATDFIMSNQKLGSWGYHPGKEPSTEATAWCAIACRHSEASIGKAAINYLIAAQNIDGGWSTGPKAGASDWCSGPAILALRILLPKYEERADEKLGSAITRSLNYLFDSRSEFNPPVARLLLFLIKGTAGLGYGRGWPWTPHCWNWVEPTSYNLLALKIPQRPEAEVFQLVIKHAHRFFVDHACAAGGWNHGASRCLGRSLPPFAVTTAEALLALQDLDNRSVLDAGLAFLKSQELKHKSAMSAAWAILARLAFAQSAKEETELLLSTQSKDGSFSSNLMVTGLAAVALSAVQGENPLIISK